jgi:hypothetical protein
MTQLVQPTPVPTEAGDLVAAIQQVLRNSEEPLTVSKVRAKLPMRFREMNLEEALQRQVTANVLYQYPKYRSAQDRFWDRPMPEHIKYLLRQALENGALAWSELRRKLPGYALDRAEGVLNDEVTQGRLHRHPRQGRGGERFGLEPASAKDYVRDELKKLFERMTPLGFTHAQLRIGALEVLHEEEWASPTPPAAQQQPEAPTQQSSAPPITPES